MSFHLTTAMAKSLCFVSFREEDDAADEIEFTTKLGKYTTLLLFYILVKCKFIFVDNKY